VATDSSGNIVVTGYFNNTVDFGGGPLTSTGYKDIFLAKYSPAGTHLWSKRFGGTSQEAGNAVSIDSSNNILLTGYFYGTVDFGGGPLSKPSAADVFLAKYTAAGAHLWSQVFGGTIASDNAIANDVSVDGNGNVIIGGYFTGSADFGNGTVDSILAQDIFVAKYSAIGEHLWSNQFGGVSNDQGLGVTVDGSGNVVVTGFFNYDVDFGGGLLTSIGGGDVFLLKLGP
jgi:hypothetical protein